jgi:hypothetical protein
MTKKEKLKYIRVIQSVLEGVIPSRAYGEGPHAKKYARQLERIAIAHALCNDFIVDLEEADEVKPAWGECPSCDKSTRIDKHSCELCGVAFK